MYYYPWMDGVSETSHLVVPMFLKVEWKRKIGQMPCKNKVHNLMGYIIELKVEWENSGIFPQHGAQPDWHDIFHYLRREVWCYFLYL